MAYFLQLSKLYLSEDDCAILDDSLLEVFESRPSRGHFLRIIESLKTHWEARGLGVVSKECDAIKVLEGAAKKYFVDFGETIDPPWPSRLLGPLLKHLLLSGTSDFAAWRYPEVLSNGGSLRICVPRPSPAWYQIELELSQELSFPLMIVDTKPAGRKAPTPLHPVLSARVWRFAEDYYCIVFDIDSGDNETPTFGTICRYRDDQLKIITVDWDSSWGPSDQPD